MEKKGVKIKRKKKGQIQTKLTFSPFSVNKIRHLKV